MKKQRRQDVRELVQRNPGLVGQIFAHKQEGGGVITFNTQGQSALRATPLKVVDDTLVKETQDLPDAIR